MSDEDIYDDPGEGWFDYHWTAAVDRAIQRGGFNDARLLIGQLIVALRTGHAGALDHPKVRDFLADRLEEALEVPAADVSDALKITRPANRKKQKYDDVRHSFYLWYCRVLEKNGEVSKDEIESWIQSQPRDISGVDPKTIQNWIKTAKSYYADPRSIYNLFKGIPLENQ